MKKRKKLTFLQRLDKRIARQESEVRAIEGAVEHMEEEDFQHPDLDEEREFLAHSEGRLEALNEVRKLFVRSTRC